MFEPFYTTKHGGSHRGLGLAWVYGIVTNHGGGVAISSQLGQGASVRVYLPAVRKVVEERVITDDELDGRETILVVDDEDRNLNLMRDILLTPTRRSTKMIGVSATRAPAREARYVVSIWKT